MKKIKTESETPTCFVTVPDGEVHQRGEMTEYFGVHKLEPLVHIFSGPVVRLNVERFDDATELAGSLVVENVHI